MRFDREISKSRSTHNRTTPTLGARHSQLIHRPRVNRHDSPGLVLRSIRARNSAIPLSAQEKTKLEVPHFNRRAFVAGVSLLAAPKTADPITTRRGDEIHRTYTEGPETDSENRKEDARKPVQ